MTFIRRIFQEGNKSSLKSPGISRLMKDNVMFFSHLRNGSMVKVKTYASGTKKCEMVS